MIDRNHTPGKQTLYQEDYENKNLRPKISKINYIELNKISPVKFK